MMKISCCIPCDFGHMIHLEKAINSINKSEFLPLEICISISKAPEYFSPEYLNVLSSIPIHIRICKEKKNAAQNRNILTQMASGELLAYQDADDLIHPSRLKLINHVFDTKKIVHLNTGFIPHRTNDLDIMSVSSVSLDQMVFVDLSKYHASIFNRGLESGYRTKDYGYFNNINFIERKGYMANGPVAVLKQIAEKVRWKEDTKEIKIAEDQDFNYDVYYQYNLSGLISNPLYFYNLSDRKFGGMT